MTSRQIDIQFSIPSLYIFGKSLYGRTWSLDITNPNANIIVQVLMNLAASNYWVLSIYWEIF